MATVDKNFRVKNGLVVEGTTGTINGEDILTTGSTTTDLTEGTNLYFTNQRALDATSSAYDPAGSAATAESNANSYTDTEIADAISALPTPPSDTDDLPEGLTNLYFTDERAQDAVGNAVGTGLAYDDGTGAVSVDRSTTDGWYEADGAVSTHSALTTGVHGVSGDVVGTTDTQTISNKTLGGNLAAGGFQVTGLGTPTGNDDAATKTYVDTAVSNLVDAAPAALDTLNELAAALGDDANFATTVSTSIGEKVAKSGDSMTGNLAMGTNKVTGLGTPTDSGDAATKGYVDGLASNYEAAGAVSTHAALTTTHGVTGSLVGTSDTQTLTNKTIDASSNTLSNIGNASLTNSAITINGTATSLGGSVTLDADDISDAATTNKFFTDELAQDAIWAALDHTNHTNATVEYDDNANEIKIIAAGASIIDTAVSFTSVEINSVSKQVAATQTVTTAGQVVAHSFAHADFTSAEYFVKVTDGTDSEVSKVLLTLDSSNNIAITEYGNVQSNASLASVSAGINGTNVELLVTTTTNNSDVTVSGTLLV